MRSVLRAGKRRLNRLRRPRDPAMILMYHSIRDADCPWALAVGPDAFEEHLAILSKHARVLPLDEIVERLANDTLPPRSVAITFDDGYADNLHTAKPLLERYGLPATVFVTAGFVGARRYYWWDELAHLTLRARGLPPRVELQMGDVEFSFDLGDDTHPSDDVDRNDGWRFHEPPPTRRHHLLKTLWKELHHAPVQIRQCALRQLSALSCVGADTAQSPAILTAGELRKLASGGLIGVGAHTMTHRRLSTLSVCDQRLEIAGSKETLEEMLDRPVRHFSYPHGTVNDYSLETIRIVSETNLASACTTTEDWLRPRSAPYQLPRIHVPPLGGDQFEQLLRYWL